MVVQGKRTWEEQARLYGKGRTATALILMGIPASYADPHTAKVTWTMQSNHMTGRAVDLAAWVNGGISWDTTKGYYGAIATAMKQAAMELCTVIEWGGDWKTTKDYPHFELKG
jgi:D-alanyl-D-alanine carboxypeptidase.